MKNKQKKNMTNKNVDEEIKRERVLEVLKN